MSQTIAAIYESGIFRPLTPLQLEDQTRVELEVRALNRAELSHNDERQQIIAAMANAGLLANSPALSFTNEEIASEEEEEELAQLFAGEIPLSEIIIEERREGW